MNRYANARTAILAALFLCPAAALAAPDPEKLRALDAAYQAGILGKDEYEAKKRELGKGAAAPGSKGTPAAAPSPAPVANGKSAGVYRMRLVRVMDKQGFGEPVEVFRMLVPSDWKVEDSVQWDASQMGCPANIVKITFRATAPDGLTAFESFPAYTWQWTDDPMMQPILQQQAANRTGCPPHPVLDATNFVRNLAIPAVRRGAQMGAVEPVPGVAQAEQRVLTQQVQSLIQAGYMRGIRVDAVKARLGYAVAGRQVDEWMSATVAVTAMQTANTADLMQGNMNYSSSTYTVTGYNVFGVRAPKGELDAKAGLFATMVTSVRPNPAYAAAIARFQSSINKINSDAARDRHRIWQEANASIQNTWRETVRQRQEVQDRQAEQFSQVIRGVEVYSDPRTQERIELSSGYRNAWTNGKGEYILSDSVNFNPSVELQEDWRQLKREDR